ncbi:MAG: hotdog fold domain-containing protein [Bacteroidota bacterium]
MNRVLKLHAQMEGKPFGKQLFSRAVARMAPYFKTIRPTVEELRHNYIKVSMKKRKSVTNHLQSVHAIAMCNLCEFAGGIAMEASIPKHRRWIPRGMEVKYLKIAKTDLTATCDLEGTDWENCEAVPCYVSVKDTNGVEVMSAIIDMKVSEKPPKKS